MLQGTPKALFLLKIQKVHVWHWWKFRSTFIPWMILGLKKNKFPTPYIRVGGEEHKNDSNTETMLIVLILMAVKGSFPIFFQRSLVQWVGIECARGGFGFCLYVHRKIEPKSCNMYQHIHYSQSGNFCVNVIFLLHGIKKRLLTLL